MIHPDIPWEIARSNSAFISTVLPPPEGPSSNVTAVLNSGSNGAIRSSSAIGSENPRIRPSGLPHELEVSGRQ